MDRGEKTDQKQALGDPETLAQLERNLRGAGMSRRNFLAFASAAAGSAVLAACGGSSSPTATTAATVAPTKAATSAAAASPAAGGSAAASPSAAGSAAASATRPAASVTTGATPASTAAVASSVTGSPAGTTTAGTTGAATPGVTKTLPTTAAGPESKKLLIDSSNLFAEPDDNDVNRDLYFAGVTQIYSGLLTYDQDFNILLDLAESYSNVGPVYTFKIRKEAVWNDGQPFTAKDMVYSMRRMIDPRTGNGYNNYWDGVIKGAREYGNADAKATNLDQLAAAVGVKAVDDKTFEVTGGEFAGLIPTQFAYVASFPVREDVVKKYTDAKGVSTWSDPGKTGAPVITTGPYMLTAWRHKQDISIVRNDKYWNAKAIRQKYITITVTDNVLKSTVPFENNEADMQIIPYADVDRFRNDAKLKSQVFPYVYPGTRFLVPDVGHPPFDKLEVRKATLLSIDKDRLVNQVGKKLNTIAYAMTAPGVVGYFDDTDNKLKNLQKYDPKAALEALKGTTFEGGKNWPKVTLSYNSSDSDIPAGTPDEIARQLKESINMDVQIEPLEKTVWNTRRHALDLQFMLYRWYQDYPDPHNQYPLTFGVHSKSAARQSYNDKAFDDLCAQAAAEPDLKKRLPLYYQAETMLQTQFIYQPLWWRTDYYAIKPWVQGITKNQQGYIVPNGNMYIRQYDVTYVADDGVHDPPK